MVGRTAAYGFAYVLAIVVGRLIVLPETNLALFWPAAGVGTIWALVAVSRRELVLVATLILAAASCGLALTGIPLDAALVLGVANVVNSVGTALVYSWLRARSPALSVEWTGGGAAPMLSQIGVSTAPGASTPTRTPCGRISSARTRLKASTAALVAV